MVKKAKSLVTGKGFTLIEVLIALLILAIGLLGVIKAVQQTSHVNSRIRARVVKHYIAMNVLALNELHLLKENNGTEKMLGLTERWRFDDKTKSLHFN